MKQTKIDCLLKIELKGTDRRPANNAVACSFNPLESSHVFARVRYEGTLSSQTSTALVQVLRFLDTRSILKLRRLCRASRAAALYAASYERFGDPYDCPVSRLPSSLLAGSTKFIHCTHANLSLSAEQYNRLLYRCPALDSLHLHRPQGKPAPMCTEIGTDAQGTADDTAASPLLVLARGTLEGLLYCPPVAFAVLRILSLTGDQGAEMGRGAVWRAISRNCPLLDELTIDENLLSLSDTLVTRLTDGALHAIAELPQLKKIAIRGCIGISDKGLQSLSGRNLTSLEFESPFPRCPSFEATLAFIVSSNPCHSLTICDAISDDAVDDDERMVHGLDHYLILHGIALTAFHLKALHLFDRDEPEQRVAFWEASVSCLEYASFSLEELSIHGVIREWEDDTVRVSDERMRSALSRHAIQKLSLLQERCYTRLDDIAVLLAALPDLKHLIIDDLSAELILAIAMCCPQLKTLKTSYLYIDSVMFFNKIMGALAVLACAAPGLESFKPDDFDVECEEYDSPFEFGHDSEIERVCIENGNVNAMVSQLGDWTPAHGHRLAMEIGCCENFTGRDPGLIRGCSNNDVPTIDKSALKALFDRHCVVEAELRKTLRNAKLAESHMCFECCKLAQQSKQHASDACCKMTGQLPTYSYRMTDPCKRCKSGRWDIDSHTHRN